MVKINQTNELTKTNTRAQSMATDRLRQLVRPQSMEANRINEILSKTPSKAH